MTGQDSRPKQLAVRADRGHRKRLQPPLEQKGRLKPRYNNGGNERTGKKLLVETLMEHYETDVDDLPSSGPDESGPRQAAGHFDRERRLRQSNPDFPAARTEEWPIVVVPQRRRNRRPQNTYMQILNSGLYPAQNSLS